MRLLVRFACFPILIGALSLTGCNERTASEAQQDTTTSDPTPNNAFPLASAPTPVYQNVTPPRTAIDALLQRIGSQAVSYSTNSNGIIICTVKCADLKERHRLQNEVVAISGACNGTVDPPTVSFPITDLSQFRRSRLAVYDPAADQARNEDVAARLQQRRAAEEAIDRSEIQDAQALLDYNSANMIGGPGQGFAVNKAQILRAQGIRLDDLRARFREKYGHEP